MLLRVEFIAESNSSTLYSESVNSFGWVYISTPWIHPRPLTAGLKMPANYCDHHPFARTFFSFTEINDFSPCLHPGRTAQTLDGREVRQLSLTWITTNCQRSADIQQVTR